MRSEWVVSHQLSPRKGHLVAILAVVVVLVITVAWAAALVTLAAWLIGRVF